MMLKQLGLFAALGAAMAGFAANKTYYVDCQMSDYTGHDGSSWEKAYETIQEAINRTSNDDTVLVKPGLYNKGRGAQVPSWGEARIGWNNKRIYLKSTAGAAETIIEGRQNFDTDNFGTTEGNGTNTMHCIAVYHNKDEQEGSIVQGFTFRKGATEMSITDDDGNAKYGTDGTSELQGTASQGGAVIVQTARFYFADCIFTENTAKESVLYGGCYIRCRMHDNTQENGATMFSGYTDNGVKSTYYACVFDHNYNSSLSKSEQNGILSQYADLYNCTFVENWFGSCLYNNTSTANNCLFWNAGSLNSAAIYNHCSSSDLQPIMSTIFTDIRLINGVAAQTAGDASLNANMTIPDEVWEKVGRLDYHQQTLPETGTIAAGATQLAMTPPAGGIATHGDAGQLINGRACRYNKYSYVYPEVYPTQYCYTVDAATRSAGKRLSNVHFLQTAESAEGYDYRFPDTNDCLWVMPPMTAGLLLTNDNAVITTPVYVDPNADKATADGSAEKPYRTIQQAVESLKSLIVAKEGTYGLDDDDVVDAGTTYGKTRINTSHVQRITSEKGATKTFIVGKKDTSSDADAYGRGPNAVRCIVHSGNMTQLQGFTLTSGYTDKTANVFTGRGGAVCSNCDFLHLDDCIVTNNCGLEGGGVYAGRLTRTYVADNLGGDYAVTACNIIGSVIGTNTLERPSNGAIGSSCRIIHSTVIGRKVTNCHPYSTSIRQRYASVFVGGDTARNYGGPAIGNVYADMLAVNDTTGGVAADALLTDPDNGDYSPMTVSPVFTAAPAVTAANGYDKYYCFFSPCYFDGTPVMSGTAKPVAGAFQTATTKSVVAAKAEKGGISVTESRTYLGDGESLSVAPAAGVRPCKGITTNGVEVLFVDVNPVVISSEAAKGGTSIVALYDNKWYVDATNGKDTNAGFAPSDAKKTLAALINPEAMLKGDIIYAAEGIYSNGEMSVTGCGLKVRANLPSGVSLIASGRREATVIEGEASDTSDDWTYAATDDMRGMGPNAVMGVRMHSDCYVKGFTFRNCYGRGKDISDVAYADKTGAAISAQEGDKNNVTIEDCYFTNNAAFRGGAVFGVKCFHCEFVDNLAVYGGGATSDAELYDCLTRNNRAHFPYSNGVQDGHLWNYVCEGCTIFDGLCKPTLYPDLCKIKNSVIAGRVSVGATLSENAQNNYFVSNKKDYSAEWLAASTSHEVATVDDLHLDEYGYPDARLSPVVDQFGDFTPTYASTTDVYGNPRIANAVRDIGAVEADWKPVYSKDLHKRVTTVTAASPMVQEVGDTTKRIQLTDGTAMTVTMLKASCPYAFPITVANGTLAITVDGTTTNYTSSQTVTIDKSSVDRDIVFAFTAGAGDGDKLATVGGFKSQAGMGLFLR